MSENGIDPREEATASPLDPGAALTRRSFLAGASAAALGGLVSLPGCAGLGGAAASDSPDEALAWTPAWRLREMFEARELSPLEFARFLVARVERHADLGAFISVFPEHLMQRAQEATEQIMRGGELPLLHGLPVSLKDLIFTKGQRTTLGSLLFEDYVPDVDSVASERLKQFGAILFAKSNTPEFGMNRRSLNLVSREARNPWDRDYTSGGSSGGAGVAAAAGLGPLALGTDGGGSIRIPSSFNGVFGLLPSRRRVPNGAGFFNSFYSGIGPMTRDVRDAAMLMQAIACIDERDPFTMKVPAPDYLAHLEDGVEGVRMGWSPDLGRVTAEQEEVVSICHDAARCFEMLGAAYSELDVRLEDPHDELERHPEYSYPQIVARFRSQHPEYVDIMSWAATLPPEDYLKLSVYFRNRDVHPNRVDYAMSIPPDVRDKPKTRLDDLFQRIDLLMCPVIGRTAFPLPYNMDPWNYTAYTYLVNAAGYCGASVPAGFHRGLPVGLQLIGRPNQEDLVLRAARAFERERPWAQHRPPI